MTGARSWRKRRLRCGGGCRATEQSGKAMAIMFAVSKRKMDVRDQLPARGAVFGALGSRCG